VGATLLSVITPIFNDQIKSAFQQMVEAAIPDVPNREQLQEHAAGAGDVD
jgi:hypothetical protein